MITLGGGMKMKKILASFIIIIVIIAMFGFMMLSSKEEGHELSIRQSEKLLSSEEALPIGTVVLLKGGSKKIMITGHLQVKVDDKKIVYDYSAVDYPEGQLNTESSYLFNTSKIERIVYLGYNSEEHLQLQKRIEYIKETTK